MSEMEGEPIDIDRGNLTVGATVHIFNYLDDSWKAAVVQEIDLTEREILVDFEDGTQEWIGVDGRKICFPPAEQPIISFTPVGRKREASASKSDAENGPHTKKLKLNIKTADSSVKNVKPEFLTKDGLRKGKSKIEVEEVIDRVKQNSRKSGQRTSLKNLNNPDLDKKEMSRPMSAFMRLQFKSNNKNSKSTGKVDLKKQKRLGQEQFHSQTPETDSEAVSDTEQLSCQKIIKKVQNKMAQSRPKETKKEVAKMKIKLRNNSECVIESKDPNGKITSGNSESSKKKTVTKRDASSDTSTQANEKVDGQLFTMSGEKKIKTLLPKRSAPEPLINTASSPSVSVAPEISLNLSNSLSSIYPTANVLPLALTPTSSGFYCPKQNCKKPCRNENMLMMHIKHYHREYRDMFSSMPNVADLAYARTVGEHIESPQAGFLEKITMLEEGRLKEKSEDTSILLQNELSDKLTNEKSMNATEESEKPAELSPKSSSKSGCRRPSMNKRLSTGSAPSSPKLSVLLAQLQEPPLVPPPISIQSEHADSELSVSQNKPVHPYSPQLSDKSNSIISNLSPPIDLDEKQSGNKKSSPTKKRRLSQLDSTDVINCLCGYGLEDGLMIQCDLCQCWQHGMCMSFENESDVPSNYICETCQFPRRHHSSKKYSYVQNWLKEGKMAGFQFTQSREEVTQKREQFLKQSHEFLCSLTELKYAIRSLQVKIQILRQTPDHPKLYLWAKSWNSKESEEKENQSVADDGPIPEDAINMTDCRKHLSEHIEEEMKKAESMLRNIEMKIEKLDDLDIDEGDEDDDFCKNPEKYTSVAKQTLLMMLRDLASIHNLKYC